MTEALYATGLTGIHAKGSTAGRYIYGWHLYKEWEEKASWISTTNADELSSW
jgi:hypothetical protein